MGLSNYIVRVNQRTVMSFVHLLLLYFLLSISYLYYVVPEWGYMGFYSEINIFRIAESLFLLTISFYAVHIQRRVFSGELISMIYLFIVPSMLCFYMLTNEPRRFVYSILAGLFITIYSANILNRISILHFRYNNMIRKLSAERNFSGKIKWDRVLYVTFSSVSLLVFGTLFYYNGPPTLTALSFSKVYEVRDAVVYGSVAIGYLINWQANVVNPVLIVLGIRNKRYPLLFAGLVLQLILYIYTAHKVYLFTPPFVIAAYLFMTNSSLTNGLLKSFNFVITLSLLFYWFFDNILISSLFVRRVFFIPPLIRNKYFEFFSTNPFINMGETSLGFLWMNPYTENVATVIGEHYFEGANANIGYLTSAYADFGFVGIIVFAVLAGSIFALINYISYGLDAGLMAGIWIMPIFNFDSTRVSTLLLTHGVFFAFLITLAVQKSSFADSKNPSVD